MDMNILDLTLSNAVSYDTFTLNNVTLQCSSLNRSIFSQNAQYRLVITPRSNVYSTVSIVFATNTVINNTTNVATLTLANTLTLPIFTEYSIEFDIAGNNNTPSVPQSYVGLTDVVFTPNAGNTGNASHYNHTTGKFEASPELNVNPTTKNVQIVSNGSILIDTVGGQILDTDATFSVNGKTGATVESTTGNVLVSSSIGTVTIDAVAGVATLKGNGGLLLATSNTTFNDISTVAETAAAYAGRIGLRDQAIPNVKYVNDAVAGSLPTNIVFTDASNNTNINIRSTVPSDFVALGTAHFGTAFVNDSTGETRINGTRIILQAETTDIDFRSPDSTIILQITAAKQITSNASYVPLTDPDLATKKYVDDNAGATTLASLTDVNIPAPTNNQVLTYNTGTSKWIAATSAPAPVRDYVSIYKDSAYNGGIAVAVSDPSIPVAVIDALILTNEISANFTNVNGLVTYSGTTKMFKITLDIALYGNVQDEKCYALVAKNAFVFVIDDFNKTLNYSRNTTSFSETSSSVSFIKELTNTDVLRVYVVKESGSTVTTINVNALNLTVTEV